MTVRYKPRPPAVYPAAWHEAARRGLESPGQWFRADRAGSQWSAKNRMVRMRSFRDALQIWPADFPAFQQAQKGLELRFRRVPPERPGGEWGVEMSWQPRSAAETRKLTQELAQEHLVPEYLQRVLGENYARK